MAITPYQIFQFNLIQHQQASTVTTGGNRIYLKLNIINKIAKSTEHCFYILTTILEGNQPLLPLGRLIIVQSPLCSRILTTVASGITNTRELSSPGPLLASACGCTITARPLKLFSKT